MSVKIFKVYDSHGEHIATFFDAESAEKCRVESDQAEDCFYPNVGRVDETEWNGIDFDPRYAAIAMHLHVAYETVCETPRGDTYECESEPGEYRVLTSDERDTAWDEALQSYIDDAILPELPEAYRSYFDEESWKRDARQDGAGHAISSYDSEEHEEKVDGEWYYIYRVN